MIMIVFIFWSGQYGIKEGNTDQQQAILVYIYMYIISHPLQNMTKICITYAETIHFLHYI